MKPLGHKAYGSIPHLPGSKRGPGDYGLEEKQAEILTQGRKGWLVVMQEKLDGSCVSVAKIDGKLVALGRAGFTAASSAYLHIRLFDAWVQQRADRFDKALREGERIVGEWMLMACGLRYLIADPEDLFVAFDVMRGHDRELPGMVQDRCTIAGLRCAKLLDEADGFVPQIDESRFPAEDFAEGRVYRAIDLRVGKVQFLGKWVRSTFEAGRYLSDTHQVWNYPPHLIGAMESEAA